MNQFLKYKGLFYKIYKDDEIEFNADMKQNTSFKVGGTADVLLCPKEYYSHYKFLLFLVIDYILLDITKHQQYPPP